MNIALLKLQSIMTKTMHSESEFIHIYTCALSSCLFRHQMLICFMVVTLATWQLQAHRFWEQRPHDHPITWSPWSSSAERMMPVSQCFQNPKPKKDWNDPGGTWTLRFHQYDIPWGCRLRSEIGPCLGGDFKMGFLSQHWVFTYPFDVSGRMCLATLRLSQMKATGKSCNAIGRSMDDFLHKDGMAINSYQPFLMLSRSCVGCYWPLCRQLRRCVALQHCFLTRHSLKMISFVVARVLSPFACHLIPCARSLTAVSLDLPMNYFDKYFIMDKQKEALHSTLTLLFQTLWTHQSSELEFCPGDSFLFLTGQTP
jgi:hypothetical protein